MLMMDSKTSEVESIIAGLRSDAHKPIGALERSMRQAAHISSRLIE
jgi:hypothetical protein